MLTVGTLFAGRFTVERELAAGGMGAVYEVKDPETSERRALKVMHPHLVKDPKQRSKFEQEARIGGQIKSGYVVKVLDRGIDPATQQPWLLMEYLEGETLASRLKRVGALPPSDVAWMMAEVGHALGAAHGAGVLHMDLKPANLFLAKTFRLGKPEEIKVLDFGIARVVEAGRTSNELTTQGGTLAWMAPEQADKGRVRATVDVWPLGLIAFQALTGKEYWKTQNLPEEDYSSRALLTEVQVRDLAPATERATELGVASRLPDGFDAWFDRCVNREPEARWPDGGVAAQGLVTLLTSSASVPPGHPVQPGTEGWSGPPSIPSDGGSVRTTPPTRLPLGDRTEVAQPLPEALWQGPDSLAPRPPPSRSRAVWAAVPVVLAIVGAGVWLARGRSQVSESPVASPPSLSVEPQTAGASPTVATTPVQPSQVSVPVTAPTPVPALAASPTPTVESAPANRWVTVAPPPPGAPIVLGLRTDPGQDDVQGFRPALAVTAPATAFEIQQHEVTWGEFRPWLTSHPDLARRVTIPAFVPPDDQRAAPLPATGVSWTVARAYCVSLRGDLPTEAQWEYAARGAELRPWPWGSEPPTPAGSDFYRGANAVPAAALAVTQDVTPGDPTTRLYAMAGNAREWTRDLFRGDHPGSNDTWLQTPDGTSYRAVRGLPLRASRPQTLPSEALAWRTGLCATGRCAELPAAHTIRQDVGFRCVR